jgi:hypothetical protein
MGRSCSIAGFVVLAGVGLLNGRSNPAVGSYQQPKTDPKPKSDPKANVETLTGCVDEQEGQWVLVNAQTMAILANLAADGFPTEGFAKYLGQTVTVRGAATAGASRPVFKVRSIEKIRETCTTR